MHEHKALMDAIALHRLFAGLWNASMRHPAEMATLKEPMLREYSVSAVIVVSMCALCYQSDERREL